MLAHAPTISDSILKILQQIDPTEDVRNTTNGRQILLIVILKQTVDAGIKCYQCQTLYPKHLLRVLPQAVNFVCSCIIAI
jgi:hypothetical protein